MGCDLLCDDIRGSSYSVLFYLYYIANWVKIGAKILDSFYGDFLAWDPRGMVDIVGYTEGTESVAHIDRN